jgi:hypothetical protein
MENLVITKENVKKAWGETLIENGFDNLGRMFDKYKKHYQIFEKDGKYYTANPKTLEDGSQVFTFTDVSDKNLK